MYRSFYEKKGPNAVIMCSEDTDFTPIFYRQYFFHTELELVESYSEHYGFWSLGVRYQVDIPMDMPWKCKNMFPLPEVLF